jgi:hypothetical protein
MPKSTSYSIPLHHTLWAMAEESIAEAQRSLPYVRCQTTQNQDAPHILRHYTDMVTVAITALEAVLTPTVMKADSGISITDVELKTRFRLAHIYFEFTDNVKEAEEHIQKAVGLDHESVTLFNLAIWNRLSRRIICR